MQLVRYEGTGEWSALYVDGKLDKVGDHYLIEERISELAGVTCIQSDDFLRGGDTREDVAPTLEALEQHSSQLSDAEESKERRIAELKAELEALERG